MLETRFDTHVATQGKNDALRTVLLELGFHDDGLIGRYISVNDEIPTSSCPLIGIHMSKHMDSREKAVADLEETRKLMESHGVVGYGHAEVTLARDTITSNDALDAYAEPAFFPLKPTLSSTEKKWDVHITIPRFEERDNTAINDLMQRYGLDWIDLRKPIRGDCRVYSAQGICSLDTGKKLYEAVVDWLQRMHIQQVDCKLEQYVDMYRVGNPEIVPPIVNTVEFRV